MLLLLVSIADIVSCIITCLRELALNKEIQDKLREEIVTEMKKQDGAITYDVLNHLNYLEMVVCGMLSNIKLVT